MEIKQKILKVLEDHPAGLSITEIAKYTKCHRNTISPKVNDLFRKKEVKIKKTGKAKIYYLKHHAIIAEGKEYTSIKNKKNVFVGTGISKAEDPFKAGKEAVEMAIKKSGKAPDFGIVFCSGGKYGKNDKTIRELTKGAHEAFMAANPNCKWIGCTTAGEISNYGVTDKSCIAMAIKSDYIHIGVGVGEGVVKNPPKAGKLATKNALDDLKMDKVISPYIQFMARKSKRADQLMRINPFAGILLTPGAVSTYPGMDSKIINAISEVIGSHTPIVGGAAGDDFMFRQTYQFANGKLYKDAVILTILSLDLLMELGVGHGCTPTNKIASVTLADGKLVKELNGRPAADVYMEMTGFKYEDIAGQKSAWAGTEAPLASVDCEGEHWLKSPQMEINKELLFFSDIPQNSLLVLMKPTIKETVKAPRKALSSKLDKPGFILFFDCGGRKTFLKKNIFKEYKNIKLAASGAPFIGFYTYSEFAYSLKTTSHVVNDTIVTFVIKDKLIIEK